MEVRREFRFYSCLILGFILLVYGCVTEPPGEIATSVLIGSGILFSIGALCVGVDLKGILAELVKLKEVSPSKTN